ncbi:50S ribosomal protein L35 [Salinisphaera sp. USBA-960]|uniref:50S ribosomal protein L35 n=1 Tax=Salinisphaera orenii TaxID=856731 RepID=UPI000DBE779C|nr:50S ribosomal protein L35 [Salifodinibacter halophilus]NNC26018.1 50S ribosomal protein L35 [Salifodinibacter halophilus]
MPKIKTHSGAAKRFKKTGSGRIRRQHAYHNHILTKKSPKRKRRLEKPAIAAKSDQVAIKRLMPYA